jgi:hypothetical protein
MQEKKPCSLAFLQNITRESAKNEHGATKIIAEGQALGLDITTTTLTTASTPAT